MKKLLGIGILVLAFLFSGNANAGVNEPGSLPIYGPCELAFKAEHHNLKKIYLEKDKKINVVLYASCKDGSFGWGSNKGKNLEALHKKTYKRCLKYAKKHTPGEDCYLYSVNEEVVWKYDEAKTKAKLAEAKAEIEKQAQIDKKPGRFFEDQPDVNDDYQIHFNYLLAFDGKDREWDINGKMEEILLEMNEKMLKGTAGHKYSDGLGKKYKFDFRKDGKLDITFVRVDKRRKALPHHPNAYFKTFLYNKMKMQNPKKIYYNFADMNHPTDGGEAGVPMGSSFLKNKHVKVKRKIILITLHELHHAQGGGFACVPGMGDNGHYRTKREGYQLSTGTGLGPTYIHEVEGCPELVDSVYLTPTSDQPYDPYQLLCKANFGIYNHPKANIGSNCKWSFLSGN
jgi:hypothetical protein